MIKNIPQGKRKDDFHLDPQEGQLGYKTRWSELSEGTRRLDMKKFEWFEDVYCDLKSTYTVEDVLNH